MFEHIVGNTRIKTYLTRLVEKQAIGNSLLFAGPEGIGKSLFADAFAKPILCHDDLSGRHKRKIEAGNHPDIHVYRPEGKIGMHTIAAMRQFTEEVYLAPFEAKWKIFIIHEAHRMLSYSANALLKTFEEPASDAIIILLSSEPMALLPTVLSRCRKIYFHPLSEAEIAELVIEKGSKSAADAQAIAAMAQGSVGQAMRLAAGTENPMRSMLLAGLSTGKMVNYKHLTDLASTIAQYIENGKKEIEGDIRKTLLHGSGEIFPLRKSKALKKKLKAL